MNEPTLLMEFAGKVPMLSVGIVAADILHLADECDLLADAGIQMLHFDVMDGVFVPQLTIGPLFVKPFGSRFLRDVHLMVADPLSAIPAYAAAGADCITVHVESSGQIHKALSLIKTLENKNNARGILAGIALLPGTPVCVIEPFLELIDIVYMVTVDAGYSPAVFAQSTERRIAELRKILVQEPRKILIGIDGAITRSTIAMVASMKPDLVVSGSAVFEGRKIADNVFALTNALSSN